jgi:hypothetical protein
MTFLLDSAGVIDNAGRETPPAGLEHSPFDIGQAREIGMGELPEHALGGIESRGDLGSRGAQRRSVLIMGLRLGGERIAQKRLASDVIRCGAVRRHERQRLTGPEAVAHDRGGQILLQPAAEGAELQRDGHRQAAAVQPAAQFRGEAARKGQAALDPRRPVVEQLGDGGRAQFVVVRERRNHSRLVHGSRALACGVGRQEPRLHRDAADGLHHDGNLLSTLAPPGQEALEAVDDFEASVRSFGDPERHGCERASRVGSIAAERGECRVQLVDGNG